MMTDEGAQGNLRGILKRLGLRVVGCRCGVCRALGVRTCAIAIRGSALLAVAGGARFRPLAGSIGLVETASFELHGDTRQQTLNVLALTLRAGNWVLVGFHM